VTDSLLREVGLHLAVATMRRGERCRLHVAPQYAFGERGSFSFPSVPPNADVEYEVRRSVGVSSAARVHRRRRVPSQYDHALSSGGFDVPYDHQCLRSTQGSQPCSCHHV